MDEVPLTRADCRLWQADVEFLATLYNVSLRRDQVRSVELHFKQLSEEEHRSLQSLSSVDIMSVALASGDVNSIREALRKKGLDAALNSILRNVQRVQRNVRGSESERDDIMPKFFAMRIWSGCSSLVFTLNPHDIKSPVTLMLMHGSSGGSLSAWTTPGGLSSRVVLRR